MAVALAVVVAIAALVLPSALASPPSGPPTRLALQHSRYGPVLVVGSGQLRGFPLYEFSGDRRRRFGCTTARARGYDNGPGVAVPLTCTGPMSDMADDVTSDDWPAFTSSGPVVAGPGVDAALVSTVHRRGIGDQVAYAGHPLYLFDPPSTPFAPQGEDYVETVSPLAPWHGYWWLVSARRGAPAPGVATLEGSTLPDGRRVLGAREDPNVVSLIVTVYALRRGRTAVACRGTCRDWVPLLTSGRPLAGPGVDAALVSTVHRRGLGDQVTYAGAPLYLYARERVFLTRASRLRTTGSAGNGQGRPGPDGSRFGVLALGG